MKKIIALILVLCLIPCICFAEVDLSEFSFVELVALNASTINAIMASDEWYSVKIPVGIYQIGVDIPAGRYTVDVDPDQYTSKVEWGTLKNGDISTLNGGNVSVYGTNNKFNNDTKPSVANIMLTDGQWISVKLGDVIFHPYIPAFSFN